MHRPCIVKSERSSCLELSLIDGHDTRSDDLGNVRAGVHAERDDRYDDLRNIDGREHDIVDNEELDNCRRASDDCRVDLSDDIQDPKTSGLIVRGSDDRDKESDQNAEYR